jgi:hypothetical protein
MSLIASPMIPSLMAQSSCAKQKSIYGITYHCLIYRLMTRITNCQMKSGRHLFARKCMKAFSKFRRFRMTRFTTKSGTHTCTTTKVGSTIGKAKAVPMSHNFLQLRLASHPVQGMHLTSEISDSKIVKLKRVWQSEMIKVSRAKLTLTHLLAKTM